MIMRALTLTLLLALHAPLRALDRIEYRHLRQGSLNYIVFPDDPASRPWLRFNNPNIPPGEIKSLVAYIDKPGRLELQFKLRGQKTRVHIWTRARDIVAKDGHFYLIYHPGRGTAFAREITDVQLTFVDPRGLKPVALASTLVAAAGAWTAQPIVASTALAMTALLASVSLKNGVNLLSCRHRLVEVVPVANENRPLFSSPGDTSK